MRDLFLLLWRTILTTGWWLIGTGVVSTPIVEEWLKIFFAAFLLLNLATLCFIIQILFRSIDKAWILDD